jgi:hypothetical protein
MQVIDKVANRKNSKEESIELYHQSREKTIKPEDITENYIRDSIILIPEGSYEIHLREKVFFCNKP